MGGKRDRIIKFFGRNKFRWGRGTGYVSAVNTIILIGLAFHVKDPYMIAGVVVLVPLAIWLVGFIDEKLKIVHAESNHNVEATTPYFQDMKANIERIMRELDDIKKKKLDDANC